MAGQDLFGYEHELLGGGGAFLQQILVMEMCNDEKK